MSVKQTNSEILETLLDNELVKQYKLLQTIVANMDDDLIKFVAKDNSSAGKRVRKACQEAKVVAQAMRILVSEIKNVEAA